MIWIISILGLLLIVSVFAIYNLLTKVEKYEDVIQDQVKYLNNISASIGSKNAPTEVRRRRNFSVGR